MKKKNLKRILTFFVSVAVTFSALCVPCSAAAKTKVSAPKKATAKVTQGINIKISWQKVSGADGYVVYAKHSGAKNYKAVKTTGGRTFSYTYQKLSTYKKYYFKVKAFKRINGKKYYSGFSKYIGAKTSKPYISAPKLSSIILVDTTTLKVN